MRLSSISSLVTALLVLLACAGSASATQVRVFGTDGRQVDAVDAQNLGQAVSTFNRAARTAGGTASAVLAACPAQATTQAFAALGDTADYALAPAGDFEGRTDGWELGDAAVIPGNEDVGILRGQRSLLIGLRGAANAAAFSPAVCVDADRPAFRFLYRAQRAGTAIVTTLRFHPASDTRLTVEVDSTSNAATDADWTAAEPNALATKIAAQLMNQAGMVQIGFRPVDADGNAARAQIDNLLVDPYRRG